MNTFLDNFIKNTLWMWLPFYACYRLTKELMHKLDDKK